MVSQYQWAIPWSRWPTWRSGDWQPRFGWSWELPIYLALFSVLLALSVIDLELYLLPNRLTYPSIVVSALAIPILSVPLREDPVTAIRSAYLGGLGYAGFLVVILLFYELVVRKEGMGMGDVKLAVLLGMWVGWIHLILVTYALIFSCVIGVVVGVIVLIARRESSLPVRALVGHRRHHCHRSQ